MTVHAINQRPGFVRALPGTDGAICTEVPKVDRAIDDTAWNVTLDITDQLNLAALFQAIARPEAQHLREALRILSHNPRVEIQLHALRDLREDPAVRQALTLTLSPAQAGELGEGLEQASGPPQECEAASGDCNVLVEDDPLGFDMVSGRHLCPNHMAIAQGVL